MSDVTPDNAPDASQDPIPNPNHDEPALLAMLDDLDRMTANDADSGSEVVAKARESLEETLRGLKLTPQEEHAVADELRQLRELSRKLDETTVGIAASGMVSRGKSSVLNALLGQDVFKTGTTHGTTGLRASQGRNQVAAER